MQELALANILMQLKDPFESSCVGACQSSRSETVFHVCLVLLFVKPRSFQSHLLLFAKQWDSEAVGAPARCSAACLRTQAALPLHGPNECEL